MIRHPALSVVRRQPSVLSLAGLRRRRAARREGWWSRRRRATLAEGFERLVELAERPAGGISARVPVRRAAVRPSRPELLAIAAILRSPRRLDPAGPAAARRLLRDGNGPVYVDGDLDAALRHVLELLEGGPRP